MRNRQIERSRFLDDIRVLLVPPVHAIDVAILAARGVFMAAMPGIPIRNMRGTAASRVRRTHIPLHFSSFVFPPLWFTFGFIDNPSTGTV